MSAQCAAYNTVVISTNGATDFTTVLSTISATINYSFKSTVMSAILPTVLPAIREAEQTGYNVAIDATIALSFMSTYYAADI